MDIATLDGQHEWRDTWVSNGVIQVSVLELFDKHLECFQVARSASEVQGSSSDGVLCIQVWFQGQNLSQLVRITFCGDKMK